MWQGRTSPVAQDGLVPGSSPGRPWAFKWPNLVDDLIARNVSFSLNS
jgi:hypothetical protein